MPALPPIDDSNTFPEKTEGGDVGEPTDLVAAADLNALKARISENREQANDALAAAEAAQDAAEAAQDAAEAAGGVSGPEASVLGAIPVWNDTLGETLVDSGVAVGAIATAQAAAEAAQDTADSKVSGPVTTIVSNVMSWNSTDGTVSKDSGYPQTFILHGALGSGVSTFSSASATLADNSNRGHVIVDTTTIGGNCTITVPHDLTPQVRVDLRVKGAFGIVLAVTGGIALTYHGWTQGATITGDGTRVEIIVESTTVAHVYVWPTGVTALPKPGGTTTPGGIVTDSGGTGSAVAVSTTVIADLVKRLGNVFTLSANTVLDDSYSGSIIFTDTSGGARQHTVPTTVSAGWNAVFVREGANTLKVIGDGTMLMKGPAAAADEVSIAVDDGGVSVIRRSATKCWCAGKIS